MGVHASLQSVCKACPLERSSVLGLATHARAHTRTHTASRAHTHMCLSCVSWQAKKRNPKVTIYGLSWCDSLVLRSSSIVILSPF